MVYLALGQNLQAVVHVQRYSGREPPIGEEVGRADHIGSGLYARRGLGRVPSVRIRGTDSPEAGSFSRGGDLEGVHKLIIPLVILSQKEVG